MFYSLELNLIFLIQRRVLFFVFIFFFYTLVSPKPVTSMTIVGECHVLLFQTNLVKLPPLQFWLSPQFGCGSLKNENLLKKKIVIIALNQTPDKSLKYVHVFTSKAAILKLFGLKIRVRPSNLLRLPNELLCSLHVLIFTIQKVKPSILLFLTILFNVYF